MIRSIPSLDTILVVDNDASVRITTGHTLQREGYQVLEAEDARTALGLAQKHRPHLIILDARLPDMTGVELCTRLRTTPNVTHIPILFLSADTNAFYAAQALDCGGDDFMRKPFAMRELNARVRALLRRSPGRQSGTLPTIHLNAGNCRVRINYREVILTPTEFSLLQYLCDHPDERHTAVTLLEKLWRYPAGGGDKALVRNHIRNLRRKIEQDPDRPTIVVSQHGRGYTVKAYVT